MKSSKKTFFFQGGDFELILTMHLNGAMTQYFPRSHMKEFFRFRA